jgi:hypothetical protein
VVWFGVGIGSEILGVPVDGFAFEIGESSGFGVYGEISGGEHCFLGFFLVESSCLLPGRGCTGLIATAHVPLAMGRATPILRMQAIAQVEPILRLVLNALGHAHTPGLLAQFLRKHLTNCSHIIFRVITSAIPTTPIRPRPS